MSTLVQQLDAAIDESKSKSVWYGNKLKSPVFTADDESGDGTQALWVPLKSGEGYITAIDQGNRFPLTLVKKMDSADDSDYYNNNGKWLEESSADKAYQTCLEFQGLSWKSALALYKKYNS